MKSLLRMFALVPLMVTAARPESASYKRIHAGV